MPPRARYHHPTRGEVVKATALNGLRFVERRLYMYPEFLHPELFADISADRLLGDGVTIDHLNDDVPGRTLDAIAAYGPTELFNEIVANCLFTSDYSTHLPPCRYYPFSVIGEYDADFDAHEALMQGQQARPFEKWLKKDKKAVEISFRIFGAWEIACEPDTRIAAEK